MFSLGALFPGNGAPDAVAGNRSVLYRGVMLAAMRYLRVEDERFAREQRKFESQNSVDMRYELV